MNGPTKSPSSLQNLWMLSKTLIPYCEKKGKLRERIIVQATCLYSNIFICIIYKSFEHHFLKGSMQFFPEDCSSYVQYHLKVLYETFLLLCLERIRKRSDTCKIR